MTSLSSEPKVVELLYEIFKKNPIVSTDSRNIPCGAIFFALRGESFNGNHYAVAALDRGAAVSVIDDAALYEASGEYKERLILVEDVLSTLQALAHLHRNSLGVKILAITGSNGKTTTKELLAAVLSTKYRLFATRGNLNNHIGVPLTLLSMGRDIELGVVEMGASSCGEIALLCEIAAPNYGLITSIGRAHLEGFGGIEGVKRGKGELLDYLQMSGGVFFEAVDNEVIVEMAEERVKLSKVPYKYSLSKGVNSRLEGGYNDFNIASALAVGDFFDVDKQQAHSAIEGYDPTNNRSQRSVTKSNTLILDCYNANPSSMEAAISNFAQEKFAEGLQRVMILGDMLELGEWSEMEHQRVICQALESHIERLILVGENFAKAYQSMACERGEVELYATKMEVIERLRVEQMCGCVILIKGSRGVGLEHVAAIL